MSEHSRQISFADLGSLFRTFRSRAATARKGRPCETIEQSFQSFHEQNPEVYSALVVLARRARAAGKRRIGIGALWERLRWEIEVEHGAEDFKLNNNYRSRYARLIMDSEPDLSDVFETRRLKSA